MVLFRILILRELLLFEQEYFRIGDTSLHAVFFTNLRDKDEKSWEIRGKWRDTDRVYVLERCSLSSLLQIIL